jgi:hypothetical protein
VLLVIVGLLLGALLVFLGWTWRHPSAFEDYGGWGTGNTDWKAGETAYVGMTFPDDHATGSVRIHGADPHGLEDSTGATLAYFLCTPDPGPNGAAIGFVSESDLPTTCGRVVRAGNACMSPASQQLLVAITPSRRGVVVIHGLDLHYADGWQNGTQRVGGDFRIRVRH